MSLKGESLQQEEERWEQLCGLLEKIPDWEQPGVADGWSVKDLLAHIAAWHAKTIDRLEAYDSRGELPAPPADIDAFNAQVYDENRDLSLHDVKVMSGACRHRFREEVAALTEDEMKQIEPVIAGNAYGHYQEHIEQIEASLAKGKA
jgi:hypothetical protein